MRALALFVLLAAGSAATSGAAAAEPADELPVPDRYSLPGAKAEPATYSPAVAKLPGKALLKILRDPKDKRRVDAVLVLTARTNQSERDKKIPYSWQPIADSAAALDDMLVYGEPLAFRRWAVYELFAYASSETRSRMTFGFDDPKVAVWWARLDALRARARRDVDPRLAEFFERYEDDPEAARWPEAKKAAGAARDRMLAARPDATELLDKTWKLQNSIEDSQLTVLARMEKYIDDERTKVPPARRSALKAVEKSTTDHRLRIGWANMVPRIMHESIGAAEARSYGFDPAPIRLGWPTIPAR